MYEKCPDVPPMVDLRPNPTIIGFMAKLVTDRSDDAIRKFIVAFYPEDSSFSVFEKFIRNSGFLGGKFLQRTKATIPGTNLPYTAEQIAIGSTVSIIGWTFRLIGAGASMEPPPGCCGWRLKGAITSRGGTEAKSRSTRGAVSGTTRLHSENGDGRENGSRKRGYVG
jgi:hypothetical protein